MTRATFDINAAARGSYDLNQFFPLSGGRKRERERERESRDRDLGRFYYPTGRERTAQSGTGRNRFAASGESLREFTA